MLCSNAEGASLKGCNFEDPSGLKANLEGKSIITLKEEEASPFCGRVVTKCFCNQVLI